MPGSAISFAILKPNPGCVPTLAKDFHCHYCRSFVSCKYLTAITGAGLVIFVIFHFIANLDLFLSLPATYNLMSHSLVNFGNWLLIAEILLLILVAIHILIAIN